MYKDLNEISLKTEENKNNKALELKPVEEKTIEFDKNEKATTEDLILGELLSWLRENKQMSTLMICRQIDNIKVENFTVELDSKRINLRELVENEKHKVELDKFFKLKGLSYKIKEIVKEYNPLDSLKEFFGDKLIIK